MNGKTCCTPQRNDKNASNAHQSSITQSNDTIEFDTVLIDAGKGLLGTSQPKINADDEGPIRESDISSFRIMRTTVTNDMFRTFVDATNYVTEAERIGWSFVFDSNTNQSTQERSVDAPWWKGIKKASWHCLDGHSNLDAEFSDHPVVHVSWNDANAFATWAGGRLPLEREWEHAARGSKGDVLFPWGNSEPNDTDTTPCNIWQGQFPDNNTVRDGYHTTAPAESFEPNGYGLFNMVGNVWEWTAQSYKVRADSPNARERKKLMRGTKVLKGGSFLCHKSYCYRYRIAARTANTPDSSTAHQGFRLVFD